ncbi:hypothetical protein P6709_19550 [Jeotgalibacillus sp. ET6]|uniref:hypothetical protein n=1 Tax=Jeotgalibacillus sp. ET6 TaxID=3037260 RepID=UPI0024185D7F|nr:hypothetical protein [Jeotgalibacillus sp. ET6]MDG5473926.1 hypothetical protein [Jeotgalibacillus sp. ET6]
MSDLKNELIEIIEKLNVLIGDSSLVVFSIEDSFEKIIEMFLEEEIREVEGFAELNLQEQKREIKEELDDLKNDLNKNVIVMKKIADFLKIKHEKKIEIKNKKSLEKLLGMQDTITTDLLPEIQVDLESLSDEFKYSGDEKYQEMTKGLAQLLEELIDKNINLAGILETIFDFDLEQEYELELER